MRTVSSYRLRDNLASYLDEIVKTETPLLISRFGKPIAVISPYKKGASALKIDDYFGFLGKGKTGKKFLSGVRRSKKEKNRIKALRVR